VTELSSGGKTEKFLTMLFNHVVRKMSGNIACICVYIYIYVYSIICCVLELSKLTLSIKFQVADMVGAFYASSDSPEVDSVCYDLITRLQLSPALQTKFAR